MDFEQPVGDVNSVIRADPDQVGVEGGWLWQTVFGPEPAEEPLPGTVTGRGIGLRRASSSLTINLFEMLVNYP
jgi:hypothetical protein